MCWADCFLCCFSLQTGAIFASAYMLALAIMGLLYIPFLPSSGEGNFAIIYAYMLLLFFTFMIALFGSLSESKFAILAALLIGIVAFLFWASLTLPSFLNKETPNCLGYRCGESHWLLPRQWAPDEDEQQIMVYTAPPKMNMGGKEGPFRGRKGEGEADEEEIERRLNAIRYGGNEEEIERRLNAKRYGGNEEVIERRLNAIRYGGNEEEIERRLNAIRYGGNEEVIERRLNAKRFGGNEKDIERRLNALKYGGNEGDIDPRVNAIRYGGNEEFIERNINKMRRTKGDRKMGHARMGKVKPRQENIEAILNGINEKKSDESYSLGKKINESNDTEGKIGGLKIKEEKNERANLVNDSEIVMIPDNNDKDANRIDEQATESSNSTTPDELSNEIIPFSALKRLKKRPSKRTKREISLNNEEKEGSNERPIDTEHPSSDYEELIDDLLKVLNPLMTGLVQGESSIAYIVDLLKNNLGNHVNNSHMRNPTVASMRRTFETTDSLDQLLIKLIQNSEESSEPNQSQNRSEVLDSLTPWFQILPQLLRKDEYHDSEVQNKSYRSLIGNLSKPFGFRTVNHQKTIITNCKAHRSNALLRPNETASTILAFLYGLAFLSALAILAMYYGSFLLNHGIEKCCVSECLL